MRDKDALLKLLFVRTQLAKMHERGEITYSDFTAASGVIYQEEQHLIHESWASPDFSSQMDKLFLDALNELKAEAKLSEELAEKLMLSYQKEIEELRRVGPAPEVPKEEVTPELPVTPEEEPTVELKIPQPVEVEAPEELPFTDIAGEVTVPALEVEIAEKVPAEEREIEEHAGITEVFRAFLHERNIRLGEIIAALIMVGFAIPLSITLWRETGRIGKYLMFLSTTLVVFGAGWYLFSRLKLAITGKILLSVTLLMIPLHFLALDLMHFHLAVSMPVVVALSVVGYLIARLIIDEGAITFAGAYLLLGVLHLMVKELSSISGWGLNPGIAGFAFVGIAWLTLAGGVWLLNQPQRKKEVIDQKDADRVYFFLGTLSYAFILFFIRTPFEFSQNITFTQLSSALFLLGLPNLYCGYQLLTKEAVEECNAKVGGTIISISAYIVTIASIIVAAFNPTALLITSILATVVYSYSSYISRKAFVVYSAIIAFGIAYISVGCILIAALRNEAFSWHPLALASTAAALAPLSLIYLATGYFLKRKELNHLAPHVHYVGVLLSGVLMFCSLANIEIARYVLLFYAAVLAVLAFLWRQRLFTYGACIVLAGSTFCFSVSFIPIVNRQILGNHGLLIALIASIYFLIGYFISHPRRWKSAQASEPIAQQHPPLKESASFHILYGLPLIHSSLTFTAASAIMAIFAGVEWTSLICGAVIILNLLAYTLIYHHSFFVYAGCVSALAVIPGLCYKLGFIAQASLVVAVYASMLLSLGYYLLKRLQEAELKKVYAYPMIHCSLVFTAASAIMAIFAGVEWTSLICGAVIILNLLAYTLIYRYSFFVYAGCVSVLAVIPGLCYKLGFITQVALVVAAYVYMLLGLGYYLLKRLRGTELKKVYAYPLVNSALTVSILLFFSLFYFYAGGRVFSSAAIAVLASIFYLFALKIYPDKLWVYPFQILMTVGIISLTWGLADRFSTRESGAHFYASSIVACAVANLWIICGLMVRNWKEAIYSRLRLPVKDYDAPFFHWTNVMDSLAFFILTFLGIWIFSLGVVAPEDVNVSSNITLCQILISSSLFFFLYRRFQRYQTTLLYISGLFALGWTSMLAAGLFWGAFISYFILTTALYVIVWYALIRLKSKVRKALEKIKLAFSEEERGRLLKTVNALMYCNTALALFLAFVRINSTYGIAAIFMMAAIYLLSAFDRKRKGWSYLAIAISSLACFAALSVFLPLKTYGWTITIPFGLFSLGLAYFWEMLGVWMHKRREGMDFLSEPCKWMGIVFTAVAFIFTCLFVPNVPADDVITFQVSAGLFVLAGVAIFYLWIAWVFQTEAFVYIAEIALAGTFMFLRITMPQWFESDIFGRFWPVIVVGISFATTGLSYVLQKLKLLLYVRPSYYTAVLLPLIPFIGAWFIGLETNIQTLFGMGIFYSVISYVRRQKRYGYIAVAIFNIALQALFIWQGIRFGLHPQVFVAPIGITLIGIAQLNRHQMDKKTLRFLCSFASAIIYVSSTVELYTFGGWAPPIILAGVCVLGILAGIALRVRPFLYLGTAFLLMDIFIQIYNAGRTNTWIWWISGVAFGLIILILFAYFERKRERILILLRSLKDWD